MDEGLGASLEARPRARKSSFRRSGPGRGTVDDIRCRKKVKFANLDTIHVLNRKLDASSQPAKRMSAPKDDDPKTSEYKSYKKLIEEIAKKFHFDQQSNQVSCAKKINSMEESGNEIPPGCETRSPPTHIEVTPNNQISPFSPIESSDNQVGAQCSIGGLFREKRCIVLKLAAEALSLEVDEFVSKSSDLIPKFLQRLGIGRKTNNHVEALKPSQKGVGTMDPLIAVHSSEVRPGELHEALRWDTTSTSGMRYGEMDVLELCCNKSRELKLSWHKNSDDLACSTWPTQAPSMPYNEKDWLMDFRRREMISEIKSAYDVNQRMDIASFDVGSRDLCGRIQSYVDISRSVDCAFNDFPALDTSESVLSDQRLEAVSSPLYFVDMPHFPCEAITSVGKSAEQSLVPYRMPSLFEGNELHTSDTECTKDQYPLNLLCGEENDMDEGSPNGAAREDSASLPLALYQGQTSIDLVDSTTDGFGGTISKRFRGHDFMLYQERECPGLDAILSLSSPNLFQERDRFLIDFFAEHFLINSSHLIDEQQTDGAYSHGYGSDVFGRYVNTECDFYKLSSGSGFSSVNNDCIYKFMPIGWYEPDDHSLWPLKWEKSETGHI